MFETLTHSDLIKCGKDEEKRMRLVETAILDFQQSEEYKWAEKASKYYDIENPEIEAVEKIIYDMKGIAHRDLISPNNKIRNGYFPSIIDGHVSHLLANGISFSDGKKKKLGNAFDDVSKAIYRESLVCGCAYGFYNGEKTIRLPYLNTAQLVDDYTGALTDAVYYSQIADNKPKVYTLYEPDGFTEYVQEENERMEIKTPKTPYSYFSVGNIAEGEYFRMFDDGSRLPIMPMYSKNKKSMLVGSLDKLVAIDLMSSQLVNNVSQSELIYWVLKNYGGNDNIADANFIVNLIKSHIIHVDDDGSAEPHQITVPFDANDAAFRRLKSELYLCMHGVDHEVLRSGNPTATEIESAYTEQRNFSGIMESHVFDYVRGIMDIAGIDSNETITVEYNETINTSEAIQNTIASAQWLGDTATTKRLAMLNGLSDEYEEIMKEKAAEQLMQFSSAQSNADSGSDGLEV